MTLTVEQQDFQEAVRDFCARECGTREQREALLDADEEDQSSALYKKLAELGWLGVAIPEECGGSGGTYVEQTILFEELWRGLAPVKALGPTTTVAGCYKRFGSEQQKHDALSAIAGGEIMSISISSPARDPMSRRSHAGRSRLRMAMYSTARRRGARMHRAGRILLVARTSRDETAWV
jgi:alkylation response protein AidB-like acyl-CoA dehydrogenase